MKKVFSYKDHVIYDSKSQADSIIPINLLLYLSISASQLKSVIFYMKTCACKNVFLPIRTFSMTNMESGNALDIYDSISYNITVFNQWITTG